MRQQVPTVTPSVLTLAMWIGLGGVAGCDRPPEPEEDSWLDRTVRAGGAPRHWPRRGVEATLPWIHTRTASMGSIANGPG
jgi:hypothetical protein